MAERTPTSHPIGRLTLFDQDELVGARWWQQGVESPLVSDSMSRRAALTVIGVLVGAPLLVRVVEEMGESDPPPDTIQGSTEMQRAAGWAVGTNNSKLDWADGTTVDVDGTPNWKAHVRTLAQDTKPPARWLPWSVPTLLQMPGLPVNTTLAEQCQPINNQRQMELGWQVGRALAAQVERLGTVPKDLLVILDLPGPQAVATAAGLADTLAPVFVLDNCPHPAGVVPAHLTIGALLYLLPRFLSAPLLRDADAPPVLVLDASRLAAYRDESDRFDNRYTATLPATTELRERGINHVLYVSRGNDVQDDLVHQITSWTASNIDVRLVDFADFTGVESTIQNPAFSPISRAWYGGSSADDAGFWFDYSWYDVRYERPYNWRARSASFWRPRFRPTYFSSSFGRVHSARWGGVSSSGGSHWFGGRSGSWTRTGGSFFG